VIGSIFRTVCRPASVFRLRCIRMTAILSMSSLGPQAHAYENALRAVMKTDAHGQSGISMAHYVENIDDPGGRDQQSGASVRSNARAQIPARRWEA
jgi:hypothetical protein